MDRMLVAVFDNEAQAIEGKAALLNLDREGVITVYACAVLLKHADATTSVMESDEVFAGSPIESFIALLGGPPGLASFALVAGSSTDLDNSGVGADFIDEIEPVLTANKVAVVAEIEEESTEAIDTCIEALRGIVCRRSLTPLHADYGWQEIDAMKADLARFKAELERTRSERKARLQEKIDQLEVRILARISASDRRQAAAEKQGRIKRALLRENAIAAGRALRDLAKTPVF